MYVYVNIPPEKHLALYEIFICKQNLTYFSVELFKIEELRIYKKFKHPIMHIILFRIFFAILVNAELTRMC